MNNREILNYCDNILQQYLLEDLTWRYENGVFLSAAQYLFEVTNESKYLYYILKFLEDNVLEDGKIRDFDENEFNIDNVNCGKLLFLAYEITKKDKYLKSIDFFIEQLKKHPRTKSGNFWHKNIYPNQVWLDGLYMCQPFYMEYETKFNKMRNYKDIYSQFINVRKCMYDDNKHLYYHAYDESREMFWCDKTTGLSKNFWLRAVGWYVMALVDTLEKMNEQIFYEYRALRNLLKEAIDGMLQYQDKSGMWYQVIDQEQREGNYLETSGTAMLAYTILKAVRLGFLPERYKEYGLKAFDGIVSTYFNEQQLGGICLVAGLGGKQMRSGTFEYYISEPIVKDEKKGVGAFMMAFSEVLRVK